jgi:hypothetical protein
MDQLASILFEVLSQVIHIIGSMEVVDRIICEQEKRFNQSRCSLAKKSTKTSIIKLTNEGFPRRIKCCCA